MPDVIFADAARGAALVQTVSAKFRESFPGSAVRDGVWDTSVGTGGSLSVASGQLTMASGTTANSVTSVTGKQSFTVPFRLSVGLTLSQRIANQTFFVEVVSIGNDGLPDGLNQAAWVFDGTTATQAKYQVQAMGLTALASSAVTVVTTASTSLFEIEPFSDECWWHSSAVDSTGNRTNSYRRQLQSPDPNALYEVRLRWVNGGTAPASSTNAVVSFTTVSDYAEITAEITAGRGQASGGQAIATVFTGSTATGTASLNVQGPAAHDAVISGNPVRIAGRALSAAYTTVATGDIADLVATLQGVQVTRPWQIPELEWSYASAAGGIINTTDVPLAATAGAGLRRYITTLQLKNTSAIATEVVLKDGSTIIWRGHVSASMTLSEEIIFNNPLRTSANAALNVACITTAAAVYVNAQGFTAP
jgi:hypothetical protein